jgi:4-aminobutyrate aminotransferase
MGKGGLHGNVLRLAPPMTLTAEEAAEALDVLTASVASVQESQVQEGQP